MKSGRKPLPSNQRRVPLTVFIAPETNQKLREIASNKGLSLGKVIDQATSTWSVVYEPVKRSFPTQEQLDRHFHWKDVP